MCIFIEAPTADTVDTTIMIRKERSGGVLHMRNKKLTRLAAYASAVAFFMVGIGTATA
jgi:hypothetical protein